MAGLTVVSPWFSFLGCPVRRPGWLDAVWVVVTLVLLGSGAWAWAMHGGPDRIKGLMGAGAGAWAVGQHRLGMGFHGPGTFRATFLWLLGSGGCAGLVIGAHAMGWI